MRITETLFARNSHHFLLKKSPHFSGKSPKSIEKKLLAIYNKANHRQSPKPFPADNKLQKKDHPELTYQEQEVIKEISRIFGIEVKGPKKSYIPRVRFLNGATGPHFNVKEKSIGICAITIKIFF